MSKPPDFKQGQVWRAKRPSNAKGFVNDRVILHVSLMGTIQYDGPALRFGRHYPSCTIESFEKWAGRQVGSELPEGEWALWNFEDSKANK